MRRRSVVAVLAAGAVGGMVAKRRRHARAVGRAEVWFDDGSMVSVPGSSPAGARLVELAGEVLRTAP
jgi:hypothetical protein